VKLAYCDACEKNEGVYHVTLRVDLIGPTTTRAKHRQFWLCAECEKALQQILCDDGLTRRRIARRMTEHPSYLSKYRDWRGAGFFEESSSSPAAVAAPGPGD
jgi:hypothetical protein